MTEENITDQPAETPDPAEASAEAPVDTPSADTLTIPESPSEAAREVSEDDMLRYGQEALEGGGVLSDESYAELESKGYARAMVDGFVQGQMAIRQQQIAQVHEAVGGKEAVESALQYAAGLPQAEKDALQAALGSSPVEAQVAILRDLLSRSGARTSLTATTGAGAGQGGRPFETFEQLVEAQQDPRYSSDPSYRQEVAARLKISKI